MSFTSTTIPSFAIPPIPSRRAQRIDEGLSATIYAAGSTALKNLMQPMGCTAFYIGVSGRRDHLQRIANRRFLQHGSILADPAERFSDAIQLPKGDEHFLNRIKPEDLNGHTLPPHLQLIDGVFVAKLPPPFNATDLDTALADILVSRSLNHFLDTDDGRQRMVDAGYNPAHRLFTDYRDIGDEVRRSQASEIYLIRPRAEAAIIVAAINAAIASLVATHAQGNH